MSKQSMREEAERLIRETMERKAIVVKQGNTRIEATCGKCGAPNRVSVEKGVTRVKFVCKVRTQAGDALVATEYRSLDCSTSSLGNLIGELHRSPSARRMKHRTGQLGRCCWFHLNLRPPLASALSRR